MARLIGAGTYRLQLTLAKDIVQPSQGRVNWNQSGGPWSLQVLVSSPGFIWAWQCKNQIILTVKSFLFRSLNQCGGQCTVPDPLYVFYWPSNAFLSLLNGCQCPLYFTDIFSTIWDQTLQRSLYITPWKSPLFAPFKACCHISTLWRYRGSHKLKGAGCDEKKKADTVMTHLCKLTVVCLDKSHLSFLKLQSCLFCFTALRLHTLTLLRICEESQNYTTIIWPSAFFFSSHIQTVLVPKLRLRYIHSFPKSTILTYFTLLKRPCTEHSL